MGCQTDIAEKIVEKQAGYVLAVKGNQKLLHEAIAGYFEVAIAANNPALCQLQAHEETHPGHCRIETRRCYLSACPDTLPDAARWKGLKSIGMVESEHFINGEVGIERRHDICTLTDVNPFARTARAHCCNVRDEICNAFANCVWDKPHFTRVATISLGSMAYIAPWGADQNMHMLFTDCPLNYPNLERFACLPDQLPDTLRHLPFQHLVAIFCYPYKMALYLKNCVTPVSVFHRPPPWPILSPLKRVV